MAESAHLLTRKITTALETVRSSFQNGDLDTAKATCHSILEDAPTNAEAWYFLGLVAYRQGRKADALNCLRSAAEHDPTWAEACNHYGNALREHGRLDEAIEKYLQARGLKSNYAAPDYNIGLVLVAQGKAAEAAQAFRKALDIDTDFVPAWNSLGLLFHNNGKSLEAVDHFHESLRRIPENLEALNNLGIVLIALKKWDEAVEICRKAVAVAPGLAEVHNTLGIALREVGRRDESSACYKRAIELKPDYAEAYNNLGQIYIDTVLLEEAEVCCRRALAIRPSYPEALNNLGIVLKEQGRFADAEECCRLSLTLLPSNPEALNNLGIILRDKGSIGEAATRFENAIALQPACAVPWYNLGLIRMDQADLEGAVNCYRQALRYLPDYPDALNNLGTALSRQGCIDEALAVYREGVASASRLSYIHSSFLLTMQYSPHCSAEDIFMESKRWEKYYGKSITMEHVNVAEPTRKLRIGIVSPDFRRHSVSYFLRAFLANYSRDEIMLTCYADVPVPDDYTDYFRATAECWRETARLSDEELVGIVQEDGIDILVDLAAHTGKRLTFFAHKPAPVQVTWLGYPDTTGLAAIDYRLSDDIADPPGKSDLLHSEKIFRLPGGFLCYTAPADAPEVSVLPSSSAEFITFGSFNSIAKITPEVIMLWSKLLSRIPNSRLIIKTHSLSDKATNKRYQELFSANCIPPERIDLRPWERTTASHLAMYGEVDIALDSFPYNGTTTTCEALWMGVPVVTLLGARHAGRVGASILSRIGLDNLVATSGDEYICIAENLVRDRERLYRLRKSLRQEMLSSPLLDGTVFARNMETAFRRMWITWCASR